MTNFDLIWIAPPEAERFLEYISKTDQLLLFDEENVLRISQLQQTEMRAAQMQATSRLQDTIRWLVLRDKLIAYSL